MSLRDSHFKKKNGVLWPTFHGYFHYFFSFVDLFLPICLPSPKKMADIHHFDDKLPHFIALQSLEITQIYSECSYGVSACTRMKKKYQIPYILHKNTDFRIACGDGNYLGKRR